MKLTDEVVVLKKYKVLSVFLIISLMTCIFTGCPKIVATNEEPTSITGSSVSGDTATTTESVVSDVSVEATVVETTPAPTPIPTPTPEPEHILISFIGDCTLGEAKAWDGSPIGFDAVVNGDYTYNFKNASEILSQDDMTLANLEGALTTATSYKEKEFVFGSPLEYVQILQNGSVEAVNLANNHSEDYWQQGLDDTRQVLTDNGIVWSDEAYTGIYEVKGIKIGMAGTTFPTNQQAMYNAIDYLKGEGCNIIIISCHWGIEKDYYPRQDQITLGHNLIDYGADIVIGTHPHRLQPIEYYNGHYIAYSLSNFVFGGNTSLGDPDTCILQCEFVMDETNTYVESYNINVIPYRQTTKYPGNDYCPMPYDWSSDDYYRVLERLDWLQEDE